MKRSGSADLPLHYGKLPPWLYERMAKLGLHITEAIVQEYGQSGFLSRISDPFWFQSFGAVMGMDWHSSGITTSVMGALKKALNPVSKDLGIYICGGRGKHSRQTPDELLKIADITGLDGNSLVRSSKLAAKVDNTAIQDGFNLYLHSFILTNKGEWAIVQQGMNETNRYARRYHWHSTKVDSFVEEPHSSVIGENQGLILNLTHKEANNTRGGIINISQEKPDRILNEARKIRLPENHDVLLKDVDLKRLGTILTMAYDKHYENFEDLLLLKGLGPKTIRSLTLVSEVIHGTPSRFRDPARYSFAKGGKDGKPFPVQLTVYDETIDELRSAVERSKIGNTDKAKAIKSLVEITNKMEKNFTPDPSRFEEYKKREIEESKYFGGRTVFDGKDKPYKYSKGNNNQLKLF